MCILGNPALVLTLAGTGLFRPSVANLKTAVETGSARPRPIELGLKVKEQMIKPKRSAEQQVADEANRRALNPLASRQTISDSQAEPEFQENHKRLRADRLERGAKVKE
jgi:hypothetical protein